MASSGSAARKIASCALNLMGHNCIMNDFLLMLASFHTAFIFPHFKFLQNGDPEAGGMASFLVHYMTMIYHCMLEDMVSIEGDKWMAYKNVMDYSEGSTKLDKEKQIIQKRKYTNLFCYIEEILINNFKPWISDLFFLSIFSH